MKCTFVFEEQSQLTKQDVNHINLRLSGNLQLEKGGKYTEQVRALTFPVRSKTNGNVFFLYMAIDAPDDIQRRDLAEVALVEVLSKTTVENHDDHNLRWSKARVGTTVRVEVCALRELTPEESSSCANQLRSNTSNWRNHPCKNDSGMFRKSSNVGTSTKCTAFFQHQERNGEETFLQNSQSSDS